MRGHKLVLAVIFDLSVIFNFFFLYFSTWFEFLFSNYSLKCTFLTHTSDCTPQLTLLSLCLPLYLPCVLTCVMFYKVAIE